MDALVPLKEFKTYHPGHLRFDLLAGLTVAIVALPRSMAYASARKAYQRAKTILRIS